MANNTKARRRRDRKAQKSNGQQGKRRQAYQMTPEHKERLAEGRRRGALRREHERVVRAYLESLQGSPGRRDDPERLRGRIEAVQAEIELQESPIKRLRLVQQRLDLEQRLRDAEESQAKADLLSRFIEVARAYSDEAGISYEAWRAIGVPRRDLAAAGITPED